MMLIGMLASTLLLQDAGDPGPGERARVAVIAGCRIEAGRLAVEHWQDPPITVLALKGAAPLSDAQLDCYANALTDGDVGPAIEDERLSLRYDRLAERAWVSGARAFLRDLGLLGRLPRQRRHEPLDLYARRLEALCGAPSGSVLRVEDGRIALASPEARPPESEDPRPWLCALYAAVAVGHNPMLIPLIPTPVTDIP
jgi:hypothetical protein